jgi:hypothetical protein
LLVVRRADLVEGAIELITDPREGALDLIFPPDPFGCRETRPAAWQDVDFPAFTRPEPRPLWGRA